MSTASDSDTFATPELVACQLPAVARLYYSGSGSRRYKRASTQSGSGEPLCFQSLAIEVAKREAAKAKASEKARIIALALKEASLLAGEGMQPEANGVYALIQRLQEV